MSFPRYPKYKDSGVEWLGEVPAHWCKTALKYLGEYCNGYPFKPEDRGEDGLPIIRIAQLTGESEPAFFSGWVSERNKVDDGELLFSWSATIDSFIWEGGSAWLNQHIFKVTPSEEADKKFLYYVIKHVAPKLADFDAHGSTMRHIKRESLDQRLYVPATSEQAHIASFLDHETARIDALVEEQQRLIELLKEKRQAVISHVITKGLDPDVPMKDSGVEWLGELPKHWEVKPLRHLGECQNGINIGAEAFGTGFPFVSYGDVYKNEVLPTRPSGLVQSSGEDREKYSIEKGDVFFTRTSETVEEIGFSSTCFQDIPSATFAGFLIRFRPAEGALDPKFSRYYFGSRRLREFFVKEMEIVTRASLGQDLLKRMSVPIPSVEEQIRIAQHLDVITQKIDSLLDQARAAIKLLEERRSAMISAAVTGKIDVRGWQPPAGSPAPTETTQTEMV